MTVCVAPLVVSLLVDEASQIRWDALRRHFPPDRLVVRAHVTLFHALPAEHHDEVVGELRSSSAREPFAVEVTGVRSLGRGGAWRWCCAATR